MAVPVPAAKRSVQPPLAEPLRLQAGSIITTGTLTDAQPLLLQGYEGMKQREAKTPGADSPDSPPEVRLTQALERLVQLYDAWDKPDEVAKWRTELEKTKENH